MLNHNSWTFEKAEQTFALPFNDLIFMAHNALRQYFDPNTLQVSTLLNIKTMNCSENCTYCAQSAHHHNHMMEQPIMNLETVIAAAKKLKAHGSNRLCMGAAWRGPEDGDLEKICEMIRAVKALGLEACASLGMLTKEQTQQLKQAGLDYYNHNIDTSPEYYAKVVTTRTFADRLQTLQYVREAGIKVCCGGIIGLGETNEDRIKMLVVLANLPIHPESIPINQLIPFPGTPLEKAELVDPFDFVRTIALARIMMPCSYVRLAAGRSHMSDELQALCFFAGANSIFYGEKLLTAPNALPENDARLLKRLGLNKASVN